METTPRGRFSEGAQHHLQAHDGTRYIGAGSRLSARIRPWSALVAVVLVTAVAPVEGQRNTLTVMTYNLLNFPDDPSSQRLDAFVQITDGFELAEKDLEQRGPGELLGRRQHGWARFRIANLSRDRSLLESAREEAAALIQRDPDLRDPAVAILRRRLTQSRSA